MTLQPFHLAIPVKDLQTTRVFYGQVLNLQEGRASDEWIDWNFFGHQLTTHLSEEAPIKVAANAVDGKDVPCRHFGVVLTWHDWHALKEKLETQVEAIDFLIKPYIRFKGEIGEQATMFFLDPSGNALEFKSFQDIQRLFAK
jgi:hypothetical protein